jgi:DNA-binding Lrp family transcriptional regulator
MTPNAAELALLDRWQHGFPLTERPFAAVGTECGLDEAGAIGTFARLQDGGLISRIGAVVKPNTVGASTLAAMRVAPERLEEVAAIVSREPLVNHNYERTHPINLWFVIAGPDRTAVQQTIARIERQTGLAVLDLPLEQAFHIDLGFNLGFDPVFDPGFSRTDGRNRPRGDTVAPERQAPDARDRALLAAIEDGLPLVERPYQFVAAQLGLGEDDVIDRLRALTASGVVKRFGCVVRHRPLGYGANAMAVWDIPDDQVEDVAQLFAGNANVTLCYRRPRRMPDWPYNLFCMIHAKTRRAAYAAIDELNLLADTGLSRQAILFSTRCFKQRGAVLSEPPGGLS